MQVSLIKRVSFEHCLNLLFYACSPCSFCSSCLRKLSSGEDSSAQRDSPQHAKLAKELTIKYESWLQSTEARGEMSSSAPPLEEAIERILAKELKRAREEDRAETRKELTEIRKLLQAVLQDRKS